MTAGEITGLILAGGQATRWGGEDKGLQFINDRPMIAFVLDLLVPQVEQVIISANRNQDTYAGFGWPVVSDATEASLGPLAGIASGMNAATTDWMAIAPCDTPLLPRDFVRRLLAAAEKKAANVVVAHDGQRLQPLVAVVRRDLLPRLLAFLAAGGRKTDEWYAQQRMQSVDFSDCPDSFLNVNRPADRDTIAALLPAEPAND